MTTVEPMTPAAEPLLPATTTWGRPTALASVQVNLLPVEVVNGRRSKRARRLVGVALGVLVVALTAVSLFVRSGIGEANDELAAAQAVNANLVAQQGSYAQVVAAEAAVAAAQQRTRDLTATVRGQE